MKQPTLAMAVEQNAQYEQCRRPTKRHVFLATMEEIVPWSEMCAVIEPHYPKAGNGRRSVGLYYFGMKMRIGVDSQTGLAHSAVVTAANIHDKHPLPDLLHGREQHVWGDSAYASPQELIHSKAPAAADRTNRSVREGRPTEELERLVKREKSKVRARVEHVFAVVKRLWGFSKVRYRGLAKNATRSFVALGLANIYLARGVLGAGVRP